jgi:hypothetical protein
MQPIQLLSTLAFAAAGPPAVDVPKLRAEIIAVRDAEAKMLVHKDPGGPMTYYVEHWETAEGARRHVWGQESADVVSEKLFP